MGILRVTSTEVMTDVNARLGEASATTPKGDPSRRGRAPTEGLVGPRSPLGRP
jgi:hypothetical protein